jgi:PhzF family phenazine biosynthesis protein
MIHKYAHINAFTDTLINGNPAIVIKLEHWLNDDKLLNITKENTVDATAFFVEKEDHFQLRWFTPDLELDLCGHATLATAHALKDVFGYTKNEIMFRTKSGNLFVYVKENMYTMDFPERNPKVVKLPDFISKALSKQPFETLKSRDYILVYDREEDVKNIEIDKDIFDTSNIDPGGVVITSKGDSSDFVSRFFIPQATIFEDPVTGSAHASLIPYWSKKLNKKEMFAKQLSKRGGELFCAKLEGRVLISGRAKTYSTGILNIK